MKRKRKRRLHRASVQEPPDLYDYKRLSKCLNDFVDLTQALRFFVIRSIETAENPSKYLKRDIIRAQENPGAFDEEQKRLLNALVKDTTQNWDAPLYNQETEQEYMSRWVWDTVANYAAKDIDEYIVGIGNVILALNDFVHEHRNILESHAFGVFTEEAFAEVEMKVKEINKRKNRSFQTSGNIESEIARGCFLGLLFAQFESDIRKFLDLYATNSMEEHVIKWGDFEPVDSSIVDKYPDFFLTHRRGQGI